MPTIPSTTTSASGTVSSAPLTVTSSLSTTTSSSTAASTSVTPTPAVLASNLCPLPLLPANPKASDFEFFLRTLRNYFLINNVLPAQELPLFLNAIGRDGLLIYDGLPEPKTSFSDAVNRFQSYFVGSASILLKRKTFFDTQQTPGETVTEYACRLRRIAADCCFKDVGENLRDKFVLGIFDSNLGERLLTEDASTLTFELALQKAQAYERARRDRQSVESNATSKTTISFVKNQTRYENNCKPKVQTEQRACYRCGNGTHKANFSGCPAKNAVCKKCSKKGHFARVCRSSSGTIQGIEAKENYQVLSIHGNANSKVSLAINGKDTVCIADTGASVSVMPKKYFSNAPWKHTNVTLTAYGGQQLKVLGECIFQVSYKGEEVQARFIRVDVPDSHLPLLGERLCKRLFLFTDRDDTVSHRAVDFPFDTVVHAISEIDVEKEFPEIFTGIGNVKDFTYDLKLNEHFEKTAAETKQQPPRRLPPHLLERVKAELEKMESNEVICPAQDAKWISPLVPALKRNGDVRICTDFRKLNEAIVRSPFQIPTFEELITEIENAKFFSLLDARSGYHQIQMSQNSQQYLSFSTPFGNYTYKRMPFGICSAPEIYSRLMCDLTQDLPGVLCYFDDTLVFGRNQAEHDSRLREVLTRLQDKGLKLNKDKCRFSQSEVTFMGHTLSQMGIQPTAQKQEAIDKFPTPTSFQQLRSFLGLTGYVGQKFIAHYSELTSPLWNLLKQENFVWTDDTQEAFQRLKDEVSKAKPLRFLDRKKPIQVKVDASGIGLGAALWQDSEPILFASRKLTDVEQRYSQLEREFLAIVFACYRFKTFIFGKKFELQTDNTPAIAFFKKPLHVLPMRIQRWMLALQPFSFNITHVKGKDNSVADCLSRSPVASEASEAEQEEIYISFITVDSPVDLSKFADASANDSDLQQLVKAVTEGWTSEQRKSSALRPYWPLRNELTVHKNHTIVLYGDRIIVPSTLRNTLLTNEHMGHLGSTKMKEILRSYYFWPGMSREIDELVQQCHACNMFANRTKNAPLIQTSTAADHPWHTLSMDFTGPSMRLNGKTLFTVVDMFSRYPFAFIVKDSSASEVIEHLKTIFSLFGMPKKLLSDNGSSFVSEELQSFITQCGIKQIHSSVYNPTSNGIIERFHGTLKHRLDKLLLDHTFNESLHQCLYDIRRTINASTGKTPHFMLFQREMPTSHFKLNENVILATNPSQVSEKYNEMNIRSKAQEISFQTGQRVLMRRGKKDKFRHRATVQHRAGHGSVRIRFDDGKEATVNQRNLRKIKNLPPATLRDFNWDLPSPPSHADTTVISSPLDTSIHHSPRVQPPRYNLRRRYVDPKLYRV